MSGFDIPHLFSTAAVYALPFGHGKPQLNGIVTLRSGEAFTPQTNSDIANIGAVNNANRARPDMVGDWHVDHPRPETWRNKATFAAPRQFTYGNAGELFNTFNHPTFAIPQTVTMNLQFGQVGGTASTARQIQLGLLF